jgi:hypothetical protein
VILHGSVLSETGHRLNGEPVIEPADREEIHPLRDVDCETGRPETPVGGILEDAHDRARP